MYLNLLAVSVISVIVANHAETDKDIMIDNFNFCGKVRSTEAACQYMKLNDDIPAINERHIPENSIFFIQTSCTGGLNVRQACSVESAARAHPDRQINVLFVGPVLRRCLGISHMLSVISYSNVNFYRVHLSKYLKNTPLDLTLTLKALNHSEYPVSHTKDILKYVTLYKFGGVYMDLNMVVVKSFDFLSQQKNWIGKKGSHELGTSILSLSKHGLGRSFSYTMLRRIREIIEAFPRLASKYNYDNVLTDVVKLLCATTVKEMPLASCDGFQVYKQKYFYPENLNDFGIDFVKGHSNNHSYTLHLWEEEPWVPETAETSDNINAITILFCPMISELM